MHACIRNDSYMIRCDSCWLIHPWLISVGNNRTLIPRCCLFHTRFRVWFAPMSLVTPTPTFGSDLQSWRIHGNHSKAELLGCSSTHAPSIAEMAKMRRHTLGCGWRPWNHNFLQSKKCWDECPMGPQQNTLVDKVLPSMFSNYLNTFIFWACYIVTGNSM